MLPDVALLEIFDFYVYELRIDAWYSLVHVCRKWRGVVFGSPRRLNLRLFCTDRTPVRETLYVWPVLPIFVSVFEYEEWDVDNVIAALEHNDRICHLKLIGFPSSHLMGVMQKPFPALSYLELRAREGETEPVIPDSFLSGSAPQLQRLFLDRLPFPGLPKLLLSATHLVELSLCRIPQSGYISPEAMVTCLSVLTSLETLCISFESPRSRPGRISRRPPPPTRTLLPVLTEFVFNGVSEYLEHLVAQIDAPLVETLDITFFHQLIFDMPQFAQFISHSPKFEAHDKARVFFSNWNVSVTLPQTSGALQLAILCRKSDWQLSSLAQICSSSFPQALISMVEHLYVDRGISDALWNDDIESVQWLEFFHPFTAVKELHLSHEFAPRIAPTLKELVAERVTEVLPALQSLFLERYPSGYLRPVQESIEQFVSARQLAGHPITVSRWERVVVEERCVCSYPICVQESYTYRPPFFSTLVARLSRLAVFSWHHDVTHLHVE